MVAVPALVAADHRSHRRAAYSSVACRSSLLQVDSLGQLEEAHDDPACLAEAHKGRIARLDTADRDSQELADLSVLCR